MSLTLKWQSAVEKSALIGLIQAIDLCHSTARDSGWYLDLETGEPKTINFHERIALIHSEVSEALEAVRKSLPDDKLPHRSGVEVELADCLIRIFDWAGSVEGNFAGTVLVRFTTEAIQPLSVRLTHRAPPEQMSERETLIYDGLWSLSLLASSVASALEQADGRTDLGNVGETLAMIHRHIAGAGQAESETWQRHVFSAVVIRVLAFGVHINLDVPAALVEKNRVNRTRMDHTPAARRGAGGKLF